MFWFLGHEACGISAHRPRIEPVPPALEGEVLTAREVPQNYVFSHGVSNIKILEERNVCARA